MRTQNLLSKEEKTRLFGMGEWVSEADRIQWKDRETGYDCLIKRNLDMGFLCGYVGIPKTHPDHNKNWSDIEVYVHGGLTYSNHCDGNPDKGICHITEDKEDDVWWVGFDCGHSCDINPGFTIRMPEAFSDWGDRTYKDIKYVELEVIKLARKLKKKAK